MRVSYIAGISVYGYNQLQIPQNPVDFHVTLTWRSEAMHHFERTISRNIGST